MQRYNNVEVALEGSLWAEDDTIYMDVENIYGEAREEETEKETQKKTEKATEKKTDKKESSSEDLTKNDYIIPDSDKKYLTDADVENLTLREIIMRKTSYMQDMEENLIQMNCELILKVSHGTEER